MLIQHPMRAEIPQPFDTRDETLNLWWNHPEGILDQGLEA
jgi:hypothetical protein